MILHTYRPTSEEKAKLEHILYAMLSSSPVTSSAEITWLPITFSLFVFMVGSQSELAVKSMFAVRQGRNCICSPLASKALIRNVPLHNLIMKLTGGVPRFSWVTQSCWLHVLQAPLQPDCLDCSIITFIKSTFIVLIPTTYVS